MHKTMADDCPSPPELSAALEILIAYKSEKDLSFENLTDEIKALPKNEALYSRISNNKYLINPQWSISHMTLYRIIKKGGTKNKAFSRTIYLWMLATFPDNMSYMTAKKRVEQEEHLVRSFRQVTRHGDDVDVGRATQYVGEYELYRPFHIKPTEEVMVSKLAIGMDGNPFNVVMEMRYIGEIGNAEFETATGKLIPTGQSAALLLSMDSESKGKFYMQLHEVSHIQNPDNQADTRKSMVGSFGGVLLASANNYPPSAWPFFGFRPSHNHQLEPRIIPMSEFGNLPRPVRSWLKRGFVDWRTGIPTP